MKIALVSNLFPNRIEPTKGTFIKQLSKEFHDLTELVVISPVPWRPKFLSSDSNRIPAEDTIEGITVYFPRYLVIPKIFRFMTGFFLYLGIRKTLKKVVAQNGIDLVSAHWVYPDGVGALMACKRLGLPVTLHALGCDINDYTQYALRRIQIVRAMNQANLNIVKSTEIKNKLIGLGVDEDKLEVVLNGINREIFHYIPQQDARNHLNLNLDERYVLFIGNFQIEKGLNYLLDAVATLKNESFKLIVIGDGRLKAQIVEQIEQLGLTDKVILQGRVEHDKIPYYLASADMLCLPSLREGCPNVVLEALSCGTPVVASRVGAVPDMITKDEYGIMVPPKNPSKIAEAIQNLLQRTKSTKLEFNWYSWRENATIILEHFSKLLTKRPN